MNKITNVFIMSMMILGLGSCTLNKQEEANFEGIDTTFMDKQYHPGDNFYLYAIGGWKKQNPIPDEFSVYGSFHQLDEQNNKMLKDLFDELFKKEKLNPVEEKIKFFYQSGMDTALIDKQGIEPINPILEEIQKVNNLEDFSKLLGKLYRKGLFTPFYFYAAQDEKNSEIVIAQLYQGGLGLPDRDYYMGNDEFSKMLQDKYKEYIQTLSQVSTIFTDKDIKKNVNIIYNIEKKLAQASMTRVEMRDPQKLYNKMTVAELQQMTPNFNWNLYFTELGKNDFQAINVNQPNFFKEFNKMLTSVPLNEWKTYLMFHTINKCAPYLASSIEKTHFAFYGTTLSGKTKMRERWKKVVDLTSNNLGEAVGKMYVEKYFPESSKQRMLELVKNLKETFRDHIKNLDWMTEETKQKALDKLESMKLKIGYPDKWRDYSSVDIKEQAFVLNIMAAEEFEMQYMLSKIDKPVDRDEWHMFPQTVNAYYSPNMNEIVFPAAILQPPFFNAKADDAVNYGGIGAVIGHEMTHGFDDQGKQYDKNGNLNNWWNETDEKQFKAKTEKLIPLFEAYKINDSLSVNGQLTLGENIADLGGISLSLDALKKTLTGKELLIDGFNPIQRFFLSYANVWRQNIRPQELQRRLKEDVHSPAEVRVNVPVYQFDDFYTAFDVKPEHKNYRKPEERLKIW